MSQKRAVRWSALGWFVVPAALGVTAYVCLVSGGRLRLGFLWAPSDHQIQVLNSRPRCPLAQVVEHGSQQHLAMAGVAENAQLQLVGAVEGLRVQVLGVLRLRQAQDFNMVRTEKVLGQASVQTLTGGACGQLAQMQRNGERNPLAERTIGRKKKRALRQPGMQGDFRGVLVFQAQAVELEGRGIAGALANAALTWARAQGHKVQPLCSYVQQYVQRHPEWLDLVIPS